MSSNSESPYTNYKNYTTLFSTTQSQNERIRLKYRKNLKLEIWKLGGATSIPQIDSNHEFIFVPRIGTRADDSPEYHFDLHEFVLLTQQ